MMKTLKRVFGLAIAGWLGLAAAQAQVGFSTNFSTDTFDSDFVVTGPQNTTAVTWTSANNYLAKTGTGSESLLFDTSAAGGVGGNGGTSGSHADAGYAGAGVGLTFNVTGFASQSLGLWEGVNGSATSGYLALLNVGASNAVSNQVTLRIFDSNSSPTAGTVGTALVNSGTLTLATPLSTTASYQLLFNAVDNASGGVDFVFSLLDATGTTTLATVSATDTTSPVLSGQVGMRLSSTPLFIDQFSVSPVPEPGVSALAACGLVVLALAGCARRGRISAAHRI